MSIINFYSKFEFQKTIIKVSPKNEIIISNNTLGSSGLSLSGNKDLGSDRL